MIDDKKPDQVEINVEGSGEGRDASDGPDGRQEQHVAVESNSAVGKRRLAANDPTRRSRADSRSPGRRAKRNADAAQNDVTPLLTNEANLPRQQPPLAGPEVDDDDHRDERPRRFNPSDNRGIDDGFLDVSDPADGFTGGSNRGNGRRNVPPFTQPGFIPPGGSVIIENGNGTTVIPDVNVYQQKKNLAQGMMDLALLSANANQLRYVLESYQRHPYFYFNLAFISTSIIAQVLVGIGLIWKSRYNIKNQDDFCKADRINNLVTIGIFIITLVNVLISAFGVAEPASAT